MIDKTTLAYICIDDKYLMLYRNKKENDLNQGKWIGIGGHLENNETIDQCVIREIKEETNLDVIHMDYRGEILFVNDDYQEIMYLYLVDEVTGTIKECDEGTLKWIKKEELLSLNMWEGDKIFLPTLINSVEFIRLKLTYKNDKLIKVDNWDGFVIEN